MNCFLAKVRWYFDGEEIVDNVVIYGDTYCHVMNKVSERYADEDILEITLTYLTDGFFQISAEDVDRLKKYQEEH